MNHIGIGLIDTEFKTDYPTFHSSSKVKDKNLLLKQLRDYDYVFFINKGVTVKDPLTFEHFAITSQKTGFDCLTFGGSDSSNIEITYRFDPYVDYWTYPGTGFWMLTKRAIQAAGEFDENFPEGTYEDVEYLHRLCCNGMNPPFGMFLGIKGEDFFLEMDQEILKNQTKIYEEHRGILEDAVKYWQSKDPQRFPDMTTEVKVRDKKIELK